MKENETIISQTMTFVSYQQQKLHFLVRCNLQIKTGFVHFSDFNIPWLSMAFSNFPRPRVKQLFSKFCQNDHCFFAFCQQRLLPCEHNFPWLSGPGKLDFTLPWLSRFFHDHTNPVRLVKELWMWWLGAGGFSSLLSVLRNILVKFKTLKGNVCKTLYLKRYTVNTFAVWVVMTPVQYTMN